MNERVRVLCALGGIEKFRFVFYLVFAEDDDETTPSTHETT